jgi:outer membrane lipoprotein carrier protein
MRYILLSLVVSSLAMASINTIDSFKADFTQSVTDDKKKVLKYTGKVVASKPQNALWRYEKPINKDVYINSDAVTIIEPELEQAIIKHIQSNFDFFNMIKNAKQIEKDTYLASYQNSNFTIKTKDSLIQSISYIDEYENKVLIVFTNQKQNEKIKTEIFIPNVPLDYDIIRD